MRVYLADLGHNIQTVSSDTYPLGVANLATYALEYAEVRKPLEISLYREPGDLKAAVESDPPDVLALSSYAWNHHLSLEFARHAKARRGATITLMGGPNFPLTEEEQATFLAGMPEIDVAVRGPTYEGERAFRHIVERISQVGGSLEGVLEEPVPGSVWYDRRRDSLVRGATLERIRDLDEIPSPYLAGWLDPYFSTGYFPLMQITRGCPFTCQYCNSSVRENCKAYRHSVQNVKADLEYIARHVRREVPLCLADDNFGMYPWDEEVADFIGELQTRFGWPQYIRTTTGKNNPDRIIRVMRKARGALPMTSAVQSLNPVVLKNIKRDNISLDAYQAIQDEVQRQGMQAYGELIMSMPGETKGSFMQAVRDLLATGVKRVSAHQLMLLHGAPLSNPAERERFGLETMHRVVARNVGDYTGNKVIETEEVVVNTPDFPYEHYVEARVFHLLLTIYFYEGSFEEAFELARQEGIDGFDVVVRLQERLAQAPEAFQRTIDDFVRETHEELFPTREACVEWTKENWDDVVAGTLGGNLLSKYSMLGRFFVTHRALDFLHETILDLFRSSEAGPEAEAQLGAVIGYLRAVMLHVPFEDTLEQSGTWECDYHVDAWGRDRFQRPLSDYRLTEPLELDTVVSPEKKALLLNRLRTFGESATGLGKFTRTMFATDLRRTLVAESAEVLAMGDG